MARASWSALASANNVPQLRQAVVDFAYANEIPESIVEDIRLAISEAVTNAVVHAYSRFARPGSVHVVATVEGNWIELRVRDDGSGFAPRDDSPGLGLGVPLINRLADQVEVRPVPHGDGTELCMRFHIPDRGPQPRRALAE
jgi:anti-sigma regulatory factor (Ser/Thr protein kinase)